MKITMEKSDLHHQLSQKSDFQASTSKPDDGGHPTVENEQIWLLGGFEGDFVFFK